MTDKSKEGTRAEIKSILFSFVIIHNYNTSERKKRKSINGIGEKIKN
jgi:hypothetical protein